MLVIYRDVAFTINYYASRNEWEIGFHRNTCSINVQERTDRVDLTFHIENLIQFRDQTVETEKKKLIKFLSMNHLVRECEENKKDDSSTIQFSDPNYSFECNKDTLKWSLVYKRFFYSYGVTKNEIVHNDIHRMMKLLKERHSEWIKS